MTLSDVLTLARAGATEAAWSLLDAVPAEDRRTAPFLTLKGRLLKDRAAAQQAAARTEMLRAAAEAYAEAARATPATYPLINAATLSLLSGDTKRATQLAAETVALLDNGAHAPDTPYWLSATRAEALLLLGRRAEAQAALSAAITGTPLAWEDHAVTIRQFRLIEAAQGRPAAWLDAHRPPAPIHYAGPIGNEAGHGLAASIEAAIASGRPGLAFGALAAGFDIVAAEILVRHGAELHVVLPAPSDAFVAASVAPAGEGWRQRFDALLEAAASVEILDLPAGLSAGAVMLAEEMALGFTVRHARLLDRDAVLLRLAASATSSERPSRPGLLRQEIHGEIIGAGGLALGPPDRAVALLGCGHESAGQLGALTGAPVQVGSTGAFVLLDALESAADLAFALFDRTGANVVLDYRPLGPDALADTSELEPLLALPACGYPIATQSAALVLETRNLPFRLVLAGASSGLGRSVEYFSLWSTPLDHQFGQQTR